MNIEKISSLYLLKGIDKDLIMSLVKENLIYIKDYPKNFTIHFKDETCDEINIVISGCLSAYSLSFNGSRNIMFEFKNGSIIGGNLLFGNNHIYPFNIYCTFDCTLLHIKKEAIKILLHDYDFTMAFIKSLSMNSQGMNKKISILNQKSLRENIMMYLNSLSKEQKSNIVTLPITKKQLADYFGVQRQSLFRELKKLKDLGVIDFKGKLVTIKNPHDKCS